jgi:hypothetical protein
VTAVSSMRLESREPERPSMELAPIESALCLGDTVSEGLEGVFGGSGGEADPSTPLPAFSTFWKAALLVKEGVRPRTVPVMLLILSATDPSLRVVRSLLLPDTNDNRLGLRFG